MLAAAPWAHQLLTIMQAAAWRAGCASRPPSPPRCSTSGHLARMALPTWELHTGPWVSHYLPSIHGLGVLLLPLCRAGRRAARGSGSPLYYFWHDKPYLGAAHGMTGEGPAGTLEWMFEPGSVAAVPQAGCKTHRWAVGQTSSGLPASQPALITRLPIRSLQAFCTRCCTCQTWWRPSQGLKLMWRGRCDTCSPWSATPRGAGVRGSRERMALGMQGC